MHKVNSRLMAFRLCDCKTMGMTASPTRRGKILLCWDDCCYSCCYCCFSWLLVYTRHEFRTTTFLCRLYSCHPAPAEDIFSYCPMFCLVLVFLGLDRLALGIRKIVVRLCRLFRRKRDELYGQQLHEKASRDR